VSVLSILVTSIEIGRATIEVFRVDSQSVVPRVIGYQPQHGKNEVIDEPVETDP
jgi:hypothetical protein